MSDRLKIVTLAPIIGAFIVLACLGTTTWNIMNAHAFCCVPGLQLRPWEQAGINILIPLLILGFFGAIISGKEIHKSNKHVSRLISLGKSEAPNNIKKILTPFGLANRLIVVNTKTPVIFCFGYLLPRICTSRGAIDLLSPGELKAAVLHEAHHCRAYDPLRILITRTLSQALFFLPVVTEWVQEYEIEMELRADNFASRHAGKLALARAIHCFAQLSSNSATLPSDLLIAGITGGSARVAELLGSPRPRRKYSPLSLAQSGASLMLICLVFLG